MKLNPHITWILIFVMTCDLGAGKISDNCLFPTHQNVNKTITLVSDFCGGNVEKVEYEPNRNSIFDYLSWIKNVIENDANFSNTTKNDFLEAECHETNFDLSLYYRVINSQICQDYHRNIQNEDKLITFCSSKQLLDNLTQDQLFGDNYDDISYSCRLYIFTHNFISCRNQQKVTCLMHKNNSKTQYISYKETTYEDIPFCFPFTCPYFEYLEPENLPALSVIGKNVFDCMPQTCQLAHYAIAIVDSFMSLLTVLVNGLILLVATRTGHFNCSHGYFSVSLAVADLIVGLITEPCMVYNHFKQGNRNFAKREEYEDWYCNVTGFFTNVSLCASLLTLISSSGFRYFVIGRPLSYWNSRRKLKKYVLRIILITWIFSVIFGLVPIVIPYDHYWIHFVGMTLSVKMDELYIYHMTLTIGLISLWVLTLSLWIKIKRFSTLRLQQLSQTSTYRTTRETAICCFLRSIIIVFTICYLPLIITQSFASLESIDLRNFPKSFDVVSNYIWNVFMFLSSRFVLGNSFANFFVYVFQDREFTNALLRATGML